MVVSGRTVREAGAWGGVTPERARQIFAKVFRQLNLGEALFGDRAYGTGVGTLKAREIRAKARDIFLLIGPAGPSDPQPHKTSIHEP